MVSGSALVLATGRQTGLAIVRSLGRRGVRVVAGGSQAPTLGTLSRFSDDRYVHPPLSAGADRFVDHLLAYLADDGLDVVFGPTDQLTYVLAKHAEEIEATGATVAVEDWAQVRAVFDKARLFERMRTVDVPCPETVAPAAARSIDPILRRVDTAAADLSFPVVVKPRSKTVWHGEEYSKHLVDDRNYVRSGRELRETYRGILLEDERLREWPPIVQEYVPGETTTTVALAADGEIRAHFQERRLRTVPPSGGSSALLGVANDDHMYTYAERVIASLDWTGPVQVEFMERPDGEFVLIEVNGRYWGSLPFAINCGVDVPWLHYRQLRGDRVTHHGSYRTDVIQRRTSEDLEWLGVQVAAGNGAAVRQWLADCARADHTFVSLRDPLPTAWALVGTIADAATGFRPSLSVRSALGNLPSVDGEESPSERAVK